MAHGTAADVIFAFYGFGEAQSGPAGLEKFKSDLEQFLKNTKQANYSGKGAPRVVLFSPIAEERMPIQTCRPRMPRTRVCRPTPTRWRKLRRRRGAFVDLLRPPRSSMRQPLAAENN